MNTATLGASSELGAETSHEAKQLLGPAAYLVKGEAYAQHIFVVLTIYKFLNRCWFQIFLLL